MMQAMPDQQGALDGLCGAYSIVNAVGALWPEQMAEARRVELMRRFRDDLGPQRWAALTLDGATIVTVQRLLSTAIRFSRRRLPDVLTYDAPFIHRRGRVREVDWWDELAGFVGGDRSVAIIGLSKPYAHWTCVTEMNAIRAKLMDSDGEKAIHLSEVCFTGSTREKQVDWRQTFILRRAPAK